jgi:hypothetical protein
MKSRVPPSFKYQDGLHFRIGVTGGSIAAIKKVEGFALMKNENVGMDIWKSGTGGISLRYVSSAEAQ